ncbi:hypothetical protein ACTXT7_006811 [Hymenolepis weldensis]
MCGWADLTEVPIVMVAHEFSTNNDDLRVNADAYIETLQTIFMPPWIDGVANGGRLYVFQQDSAPSHEALKTHGLGVVEKEVNEHPHSTKFSYLMEAISRAMEDINKDRW